MTTQQIIELGIAAVSALLVIGLLAYAIMVNQPHKDND